MNKRKYLLKSDWVTLNFIILSLAAISPVRAADWPQHLGPERNGVYTGPEIGSLGTAWTKPAGAGFAGAVVASGKAILFHRLNAKEVLDCVDAKSGKPVWSFPYPTNYRDDFGFDEGPRSAPAIAGGMVFSFGAEGMLHAVDLTSGKKVWDVDTFKQFGVRKGYFGAAGSPLVDSGRVILNVGGRDGAGIAAFDAQTGKTLWTSGNDEASYSSGIAATLGGKRYVVFFTRNGLAVLEPTTGKSAYSMRWRARNAASVNAATPLAIGDSIFISASYETGAALLNWNGGQPKLIWSSDEAISNHYSTCVHKDGYLYGFHGRQEQGQAFRCIELKSGKVMWSEDGFGAGSVTLVNGSLLIVRENGEIDTAAASPKEFKPVKRAQPLTGVVRTFPAVADGMVFVRNEKVWAALK